MENYGTHSYWDKWNITLTNVNSSEYRIMTCLCEIRFFFQFVQKLAILMQIEWKTMLKFFCFSVHTNKRFMTSGRQRSPFSFIPDLSLALTFILLLHQLPSPEISTCSLRARKAPETHCSFPNSRFPKVAFWQMDIAIRFYKKCCTNIQKMIVLLRHIGSQMH